MNRGRAVWNNKGDVATLWDSMGRAVTRYAHGQDILLGLWPEIIDIVEEAERIFDQCEKDLREGREVAAM